MYLLDPRKSTFRLCFLWKSLARRGLMVGHSRRGWTLHSPPLCPPTTRVSWAYPMVCGGMCEADVAAARGQSSPPGGRPPGRPGCRVQGPLQESVCGTANRAPAARLWPSHHRCQRPQPPRTAASTRLLRSVSTVTLGQQSNRICLIFLFKQIGKNFCEVKLGVLGLIRTALCTRGARKRVSLQLQRNIEK